MATNVAPAVGVTPAQAAKKLRVILKQMFELASNMSSPTTSKSLVVEDGLRRITTEHEYLKNYVNAIEAELDALMEIAKKRRPSETKQYVKALKASKIKNFRRHLETQEKWIKWIRDNYQGVPPSTSSELKTLQEAYALIQAIPTIEAPPDGKHETTIRAMKAILKVHEGIDPLNAFKDVPMPDLPVVLVHEVEKVVEKPPAPALTVYQLPFKIGSTGTKAFKNDTITLGPINKARYAHVADGIGSVEGWNKGECSLGEAADTFRAFINKYTSATARLMDGAGNILAQRAGLGEPIQWFIPIPGGAGQPATTPPF